jgi:hypothetical protein
MSRILALLVSLCLFARLSAAGDSKEPKPVNLGKVNTNADEDDPFIVPGNPPQLLYASNKSGKFGIRIAQRSGKGWAAGKPIPDLNDKETDFRSPFMTRDFKLYFATNEVPDEKLKDLKNFDIKYRAQGRAPVIIPGISEKEDELHPWVTASGKELFFSRKAKEGFVLFVARGPAAMPIGGAKEVGFPAGFHHATLSASGLIMYLQGPVEKERVGLFRSKRTKAGAAWSKPEPLANLNSSDATRGDMSPCLSGDGTKLYFASDRPGGQGGLDLWMVDTAGLKTEAK